MDFRFLVLWGTLSILLVLTPYTEGHTRSANLTTTILMSSSISASESTSRWSKASSVSQAPLVMVTTSTHTVVVLSISPTVTSQPIGRSSLTPEQNDATTTKTPKTNSGTVSSKQGLNLAVTEWVLIACVCTFFIVFIVLVVLVVQIRRLNKTVLRLKDASHR